MSVYMTEEEQIALIKRFWQQYGAYIMWVVTAILLFASAYQYWQWHANRKQEAASQVYEQLMVAVSDHNDVVVKSYANRLIEHDANTVYAQAANLMLVKYDIDNHAIDAAKKRLNQVIAQSKVDALKQVARLRLARIYTDEKAYPKALTTLKTVNDPVFKPAIDELTGDVFLAMGDKKAARQSYTLALNGMQQRQMNTSYLEIKMDGLNND